MYFKKVLFGLSPTEVKKYISTLEKQLNERKGNIQKLEQQILMLEFENDDLELKLRIANEILQYRVQGQVSN